uniref:Tail protein n=1 Tax=Pakpunavirus sp. TaxID=2833053 RepID=A0AB39C0H7_9CAUD
MPIEIYASKFAAEPAERYEIPERMTLEAWLLANVPSYQPRNKAPISATINGRAVTPDDWASAEIIPADTVSFVVEPKGSTLEKIFKPGPLAKLFGLGNPFAQPKVQTPTSRSQGKARDLSLATVKGNQVSLNAIIPEIAGRHKRFPDYLVPPRRYFGGPREQWIEMLLCVGKGKYQIPDGKVLVGDTPIASLGDSARYAIYGPGETVSAEPAAAWWHSSTEVGSTSSGSAGLTLQATVPLERVSQASPVLLSGAVIASLGARFPEGWAAGLIARVDARYPYEFVNETGGAVVTGPHVAMLAPYVGMPIEIAGANAGEYIVAAYSPYVAPVAGAAGSAASATGNAAPSRYDYNVTPATLQIGFAGQTYTANLIADYVNLSGLLAAINAALSGSPLIATGYDGRVRVAESASPYAGGSITLTGSVSAVFGAAPVYVAGTQTTAGVVEQMPRITLAYDGGVPALDLAAGVQWSAIGYRGLRYRLIAVSPDSLGTVRDEEGNITTQGYGPSSITVARLTHAGADDEMWPGFNSLQSDAAIALDSSTTEGDWAGPFATVPDGEVTQYVEFDCFFPQGLIRYTERNGNPRQRSVRVEIQYRDMATAGAWTSRSYTFTATTQDQIGFTRRFRLPSAMRAEVRMRRIGAEAAETNIFERVQWYGLRARINKAPARYPGVTVMAVYIRGSSRLAAQSESLVSVEATRILPVRSGGAWAGEAATRDIAPWVMHVAKSAGYTDGDLDMAELDRLHAIWSARGDYYDAAIESAGTVKQSLLEALQAGFADFTIDRGLIRPVRDELRTVMEHPYTPQNMTRPLSRQFSALKPDDFDGVDVEYTDGKTWQKETVQCRLPGDAGLRVEKIRVEGVTGRTQAWRIGMRRRMEQKYRRWSYSFGTELDALNSRYLSYVPLQDDVPGYGQSALMLSYDSGIIESSEPFDWSAGGAHVVGIRRTDGTLSGPYAATRIDDYRLSISGLDFDPDTSWSIEPPHLLFGPVNRWSYPALITSISPSGTDGASVEAVNYSPLVYTYDNATPPA